MTVIKHIEAERLTRGAVVLDLGDLKEQARAIIADAEHTAQRLLLDARAEARRLTAKSSEIGRVEGYAAGHEQGLDEGRDVGRREAETAHGEAIRQTLTGWNAALVEWEQQRRDMLMAAREDVIALAVAIGERITHRVIEHSPELVTAQVAEALSLVSRRTEAVVRLHPDDRAFVEPLLDEILSRIDACTSVRLMSESSMTRGGCVVTTEGGMIDASIETQLRRITEALLPDRRERLGEFRAEQSVDEACETDEPADDHGPETAG